MESKIRDRKVSTEEMIREIDSNPNFLMEIELLTKKIPNLYEAIVYIQKRANEINFIEWEYINAKKEEFEAKNPQLVEASLLDITYDPERIKFFTEFRKGLRPDARAIKEFLEDKLVCKNLRKG